MKKMLLGLFAVLVAIGVYATPDPIFPQVYDYLKYPSTDNRLHAQKVARASYSSVGVQTIAGVIGDHKLGVFLPKNAIITRSYIYIKTAFTDNGAGTIALTCEDAGNIKAATDLTSQSADALVEGETTGAATTFKKSIAAGCEITATLAGASVSTGKLDVWVEYVVSD